jgi:hypothetical protein
MEQVVIFMLVIDPMLFSIFPAKGLLLSRPPQYNSRFDV